MAGLAWDVSPLSERRIAPASGLLRLMDRDPFTDQLTFIHDSGQVAVISLAAEAMAADLPAFGDWLLGILRDTRLRPAGRFLELIHHHVAPHLAASRHQLSGGPDDDPAVLALLRWMVTANTPRLP